MTEIMKEKIEKLKEIQEKNLLGGGLKHIERQHSRNKLTARERINILLDPGTFRELGSCANTTGMRMDGRTSDAPCDGAVIGTGMVHGRRVTVYASDFTVLGGSIGTQHIQKFGELIKMSAKWGIPMVWLTDSSGGRLGYQDVTMAGMDWYFLLQARYSGFIPQINVLMGPCIAGQAYAPTLCDFLLMSRESGNLWLGGPRQTEAATSEKFNKEVGSPDYHMALSGTCDLVGANDEETILETRTLLSYLPSNCKEKPPVIDTDDDPRRDVNELESIVPDVYDRKYDMHDVIEQLVDDGQYFEIKKDYAKNLITCFCRFDGRVTGLVANNPGEAGSILEINSVDKYYRFLQVLDAYNIPLVNLVDTPPLLPGEGEEKKGLLRHFGKILDVYATSTIPKISITLRESYADAGSMIMGGVKGMGGDLSYAWPIARFAVQASEINFQDIYGGGIEEDAYEAYLNRSREKVDVFDIARAPTTQMVDEIIEPGDTRKVIIEALEITQNKEETLPPRAKMHGTPPT